MRKVKLSMLTPDMRLGKNVYYGSNILIRAGTKNLNRFSNNLQRFGINNLYIEDEVCEGIEIEDIVCDELRHKCKQNLKGEIEKLNNNFAVDHAAVSEIVDSLMDEIMGNRDVLFCLSEIGNTDESTLDHSVNTTIYAIYLGRKLGYGRGDLKELSEGILLHDLGKTALRTDVLFKPGKLNDEEFAYVKTHTSLGYEMLKKVHGLSERSRVVSLYHHERLDGTGYPESLLGGNIPEFCRIAAIVDVYEAMISDRCYRKAFSAFHATEILMKEASAGLDHALTSKFLQGVSVYPNGTLVDLSDGTMGIVKCQNASMPLRPIVRLIDMSQGKQQIIGEVNLMEKLNLTIVEPQF